MQSTAEIDRSIGPCSQTKHSLEGEKERKEMLQRLLVLALICFGAMGSVDDGDITLIMEKGSSPIATMLGAGCDIGWAGPMLRASGLEKKDKNTLPPGTKIVLPRGCKGKVSSEEIALTNQLFAEMAGGGKTSVASTYTRTQVQVKSTFGSATPRVNEEVTGLKGELAAVKTANAILSKTVHELQLKSATQPDSEAAVALRELRTKYETLDQLFNKIKTPSEREGELKQSLAYQVSQTDLYRVLTYSIPVTIFVITGAGYFFWFRSRYHVVSKEHCVVASVYTHGVYEKGKEEPFKKVRYFKNHAGIVSGMVLKVFYHFPGTNSDHPKKYRSERVLEGIRNDFPEEDFLPVEEGPIEMMAAHPSVVQDFITRQKGMVVNILGASQKLLKRVSRRRDVEGKGEKKWCLTASILRNTGLFERWHTKLVFRNFSLF